MFEYMQREESDDDDDNDDEINQDMENFKSSTRACERVLAKHQRTER